MRAGVSPLWARWRDPYPPPTPLCGFGVPPLSYTYYYAHYTTHHQKRLPVTRTFREHQAALGFFNRPPTPLVFLASVRLPRIQDPHPYYGTLTGPHTPLYIFLATPRALLRFRAGHRVYFNPC